MTIMKVLLLNGSPRKEGCTYTALTEIAETLKKERCGGRNLPGRGSFSGKRCCRSCHYERGLTPLLLVLRFTGLLLPDRSSNSWINSLPRPERIWSTSLPQLLLPQDVPVLLLLWMFWSILTYHQMPVESGTTGQWFTAIPRMTSEKTLKASRSCVR